MPIYGTCAFIATKRCHTLLLSCNLGIIVFLQCKLSLRRMANKLLFGLRPMHSCLKCSPDCCRLYCLSIQLARMSKATVGSMAMCVRRIAGSLGEVIISFAKQIYAAIMPTLTKCSCCTSSPVMYAAPSCSICSGSFSIAVSNLVVISTPRVRAFRAVVHQVRYWQDLICH